MLRDEELSYRIRGWVHEVYRNLGHGFLEKVYENALLTEFAVQGVNARSQVPIGVTYKGKMVWQSFADVLSLGKNRLGVESPICGLRRAV